MTKTHPIAIEASWSSLLNDAFNESYFARLSSFVREEYKQHSCFPPAKDIFAAFDRCPVDKVRIVILGQDPYHGPGQANGLCFSVNDSISIPPSLRNIFQELESDVGKTPPPTGNLTHWAMQGVLLLNATLTVRAHQAGSHQKQGWEEFTDTAIQRLSEAREGIIFLLWGSFAQKKAALIDTKKHHILKAPHPSPLSAYRGFFGCKHFSQSNEILKEMGQQPIVW